MKGVHALQVGLLLTQRNQDLRVLGLQLLAHLIDAQVMLMPSGSGFRV